MIAMRTSHAPHSIHLFSGFLTRFILRWRVTSSSDRTLNAIIMSSFSSNRRQIQKQIQSRGGDFIDAPNRCGAIPPAKCNRAPNKNREIDKWRNAFNGQWTLDTQWLALPSHSLVVKIESLFHSMISMTFGFCAFYFFLSSFRFDFDSESTTSASHTLDS